nr:uncharacterized protein LOC118878473 [Drosophila suzukii]
MSTRVTRSDARRMMAAHQSSGGSSPGQGWSAARPTRASRRISGRGVPDPVISTDSDVELVEDPRVEQRRCRLRKAFNRADGSIPTGAAQVEWASEEPAQDQPAPVSHAEAVAAATWEFRRKCEARRRDEERRLKEMEGEPAGPQDTWQTGAVGTTDAEHRTNDAKDRPSTPTPTGSAVTAEPLERGPLVWPEPVENGRPPLKRQHSAPEVSEVVARPKLSRTVSAPEGQRWREIAETEWPEGIAEAPVVQEALILGGRRSAIVEAQDRLLVPEQTAPQKLNTERDTAAESAVNAALAQAAQTYRASQELGVSQALREEIKLLNDVHKPAESKLQPLQESASRQVSMVPTPSCPEGGANGPAEIQQRQDTGGCYRRPPELPPRQRPRLSRDRQESEPGTLSSDRQERSPRTAMAHRGRRIFGTSRGYTPTREPATETATSEWTAGTSHSAERSSCSGSTSEASPQRDKFAE